MMARGCQTLKKRDAADQLGREAIMTAFGMLGGAEDLRRLQQNARLLFFALALLLEQWRKNSLRP